MRITTIFVATVLICAGCISAQRQIVISSEVGTPPNDVVMIQRPDGSKVPVSREQLAGIARLFAEEQKLGFDFDGVETNVWVNSSGRTLVDVDFSSGRGKPYLNVSIDKYGKVIKHEAITPVCGTK